MGSRPSLCLAATAILLGCGDVRAVPPPLQDQGPPEDDLAANTPAADVDEGLSGAAVDGASEQGAEASPEPGSDSAGDNDDGAASGAATPEQTGTPDEGPDHGTGPGDWGPGDYPDDPFAQEYLEMSGVAGQPGMRPSPPASQLSSGCASIGEAPAAADTCA